MSKKFVSFILFSTFFLFAAVAANNKFTLVIDPGHGGRDAGALGSFSKEKDINLNVALAFGRNVERNCPDVRVIYTRTTDVFIPLKERANIANKNKADLFVSVHTNALPGGKQAFGMETYTLGMHRAGDNFDVAKRENSVILVEKDYKQVYQGFNPNSSESYIMFEFMQDKNMANSVDMAKMVQQETCAEASRPDKGVHQAGFLVLRETSMPGCLIELGFITTPEEERLLNDNARIEKIATGIYRAFLNYKNKYYNNIVVPYKASATQTTAVQNIVHSENMSDDTKKKKRTRKSSSHAIEKNAEQNEALQIEQRTDSRTETGSSNSHTDTVSTNAATAVSETATTTSTPRTTSGKSAAKTERGNATQETANELIFKVQIIASTKQIREGSEQFKGLTGISHYNEGGMFKYTYGASANYNEINNLRREISAKFPGAFVVAFKNGVRMDINKAIREFSANKNKQTKQ